MITLEQVEAAVRDAAELRKRYLRQRGWEESCDYPDSRWRWEKTLASGKTLMLSKRQAFDVESKFLDTA